MKLGAKMLKELGVSLAVLVVGLGLVGQDGLISGMVATIIGILVVIASLLGVGESLK